jgi:hypothetical protein
LVETGWGRPDLDSVESDLPQLAGFTVTRCQPLY